MADETNKPTPESTPEATDQLSDVVNAVGESELQDVHEARHAVENTLNQPVEAIEDAVNAAAVEAQAVAEHALPHRVGDTTVIRGITIPLPLYTVIFLILGAITIVEVLIASLPHGTVGALLLIGCSAVKAVLVVLFYMHLREDSRLFAFALILPLFIAAVSVMFLLSVPATGY